MKTTVLITQPDSTQKPVDIDYNFICDEEEWRELDHCDKKDWININILEELNHELEYSEVINEIIEQL